MALWRRHLFALVESQFSIVSTVKSKRRAGIHNDHLWPYLVMKKEVEFSDKSLSMIELWHRMKEWLIRKGYIKGIRKRYKKRVSKKKKQRRMLDPTSNFR